MLDGFGQIDLAQGNGEPPCVVATGCAAGESGVSVLVARFGQGVHFRGSLRQNLILFPASKIRFDCRLADRRLAHEPPAGSLAICPAGIDCEAAGDGCIDIVMVAVDPARLFLAASEMSGGSAQLRERFIHHDASLHALAARMCAESGAGHPNGPLFWEGLALEFTLGLAERHLSDPQTWRTGTLDEAVLRKVRDYVFAYMHEPLHLNALARVANLSPFHFSRVFMNSAGMTPHRYVIRLRLQRALALVRDGRHGLADIAAATGFADQGHLSRWFKRVFGVSPSQVAG